MDYYFYSDLLETLDELEYRLPDHGINIDHFKPKIETVIEEKRPAA